MQPEARAVLLLLLLLLCWSLAHWSCAMCSLSGFVLLNATFKIRTLWVQWYVLEFAWLAAVLRTLSEAVVNGMSTVKSGMHLPFLQ